MIKLKGKGDMYEPHVINGWIVNFFPDYDEAKPKLNKEILIKQEYKSEDSMNFIKEGKLGIFCLVDDYAMAEKGLDTLLSDLGFAPSCAI